MVSAALTTLGSLGGLLGNQTRRTREPDQAINPLPAIAAAPDQKRARLIAREAEKERLYNLATKPEILGLVTTIAGILAAQKIQFSDNQVTNEGLQATATSAAVLIGLGHAGVGDLTTSIMAGLAGVTSIMEGFEPWNVTSETGNNWLKTFIPPFGFWNLF